jgi:hypothetical protein
MVDEYLAKGLKLLERAMMQNQRLTVDLLGVVSLKTFLELDRVHFPNSPANL